MTNSPHRVMLTIYGRAWCHLCDDMRNDLAGLRGEFEFDVQVVDVDSDPTLVARYDQLVPVLCAEGQELCHYRLDGMKVREYLARFR